jgi:rhamnogalacturonyl hydrolase YesR
MSFLNEVIMDRSDRIKKVVKAMLCMQRWPWEQGVGSQALLECGEEEAALLFALDAVTNQYKDGRLAMKSDRYAAMDPASNGEAVLYAWKKTGEPRFREAFDRMTDYILYRAPRTKDGIMFHNENEGHIFSDAAFMVGPFLVLAGHPDEAMKQVRGFFRHLMHPEKKLLSHIYDGDKEVFIRKALWGVGNGWSAAAAARMIRFMPDSKEAEKRELAGMAKGIIDACLVFQRPDKLFHDVVDDPGTFVETNLAQMLSYTIYCGVKAGWLDASYIIKADEMREAVYKKVDSFGLVQDVCGSPAFDHPGTAVEGQSFYLFMESAYEKWLAKQM